MLRFPAFRGSILHPHDIHGMLHVMEASDDDELRPFPLVDGFAVHAVGAGIGRNTQPSGVSRHDRRSRSYWARISATSRWSPLKRITSSRAWCAIPASCPR